MLAEGSSVSSFASMHIITGVINLQNSTMKWKKNDII